MQACTPIVISILFFWVITNGVPGLLIWESKLSQAAAKVAGKLSYQVQLMLVP